MATRPQTIGYALLDSPIALAAYQPGVQINPGDTTFSHINGNRGGSNNASTSNDLTTYQDWFPAPALETVFDLEADRIENLAFDPAVIKSEREVVYSERRLRVDNSNPGLLNEQLNAAAYTAVDQAESDRERQHEQENEACAGQAPGGKGKGVGDQDEYNSGS